MGLYIPGVEVVVPTVIFVCHHNAARSVMAAALFNRIAPGGWQAASAGLEPAVAIQPRVVRLLDEIGIALDEARPRPLDDEMLHHAGRAVTIGCDLAEADFRHPAVEPWDTERLEGTSTKRRGPFGTT